MVDRAIPADDDAPRAARELLTELHNSLDLGQERLADLYVALSELVTNAVMHGPGGQIVVRLAAKNDIMRFEVQDEGVSSFDWSSAVADGHWGLALVEAFSDRCGIDHRPSTVVWCDIDLTAAPA